MAKAKYEESKHKRSSTGKFARKPKARLAPAGVDYTSDSYWADQWKPGSVSKREDKGTGTGKAKSNGKGGKDDKGDRRDITAARERAAARRAESDRRHAATQARLEENKRRAVAKQQAIAQAQARTLSRLQSLTKRTLAAEVQHALAEIGRGDEFVKRLEQGGPVRDFDLLDSQQRAQNERALRQRAVRRAVTEERQRLAERKRRIRQSGVKK